uniref:small monomeric GTPase n=1 Tax=Hippocampus comes TaxID=109280 RepID=A0A3Q3DJL6_HIPCM
MAKQYDILFRILLLGDSGVGKTCMLRRFTDREFDTGHISTIGVDFKMKTLEIDGIKVRVQIWDTAGQERYQTITKQYYRRAQGIVFVYDITSESSFQHIVKWATDVDEYAPEKVQRILVGNKSDEEPRRRVTREEGSKVFILFVFQSFSRVTELVLQAHKRDVDNLLGSLDDYLNKAGLDESGQDKVGSIQRVCGCARIF